MFKHPPPPAGRRLNAATWSSAQKSSAEVREHSVSVLSTLHLLSPSGSLNLSLTESASAMSSWPCAEARCLLCCSVIGACFHPSAAASWPAFLCTRKSELPSQGLRRCRHKHYLHELALGTICSSVISSCCGVVAGTVLRVKLLSLRGKTRSLPWSRGWCLP